MTNTYRKPKCRAHRGGSAYGDGRYFMAQERLSTEPHKREGIVGLRVVCGLGPKEKR